MMDDFLRAIDTFDWLWSISICYWAIRSARRSIGQLSSLERFDSPSSTTTTRRISRCPARRPLPLPIASERLCHRAISFCPHPHRWNHHSSLLLPLRHRRLLLLLLPPVQLLLPHVH